MDGNVAAYHKRGTPNDRCVHFTTKGRIELKNGIITNNYCKGTRAGIGATDRYNNLTYEPCTNIDVDTEGTYQGCRDDAVIDWVWENETLAKEAMCAPGERQSGWCTSGKTLKEYITGN